MGNDYTGDYMGDAGNPYDPNQLNPDIVPGINQVVDNIDDVTRSIQRNLTNGLKSIQTKLDSIPVPPPPIPPPVLFNPDCLNWVPMPDTTPVGVDVSCLIWSVQVRNPADPIGPPITVTKKGVSYADAIKWFKLNGACGIGPMLSIDCPPVACDPAIDPTCIPTPPPIIPPPIPTPTICPPPVVNCPPPTIQIPPCPSPTVEVKPIINVPPPQVIIQGGTVTTQQINCPAPNLYNNNYISVPNVNVPEIKVPPCIVQINDAAKVVKEEIIIPAPVVNITNVVNVPPPPPPPEPKQTCEEKCEEEEDEEKKKKCLEDCKGPGWKNHLEWMTSPEGMNQLSDYINNLGMPTNLLLGSSPFDVANNLRVIMKQMGTSNKVTFITGI